jgi:hypothetical protein
MKTFLRLLRKRMCAVPVDMYVNICLSLQDRQLMEEDNDIQVCSSRLLVGYRLTFSLQDRSSQPVGRIQVTQNGRAVKPSRKAKDIVLAENEEANFFQRAGVRRRRLYLLKKFGRNVHSAWKWKNDHKCSVSHP